MLDEINISTEHAGLPPGTLIYLGEGQVDKTYITVIEYDEDTTSIKELDNIEEFLPIKDTPTIKWLNIRGIHDLETMQKIGCYFDINSLTLEDILNPAQYSKAEYFDNYLFIVLKDFYYNEVDDKLDIYQICIILGSNYVLSFQDTKEDLFKPLQERISLNPSFRKRGADFIAYALIDLVIDGLFQTIKDLGDSISILENKVIDKPHATLISEIYDHKRDIIRIRSVLRPYRDLVLSLERNDSPFIGSYLKVYLRDVYDHIIQLFETIDIYRETVSHLFDIYLSSANNRMSEVMKTLTVIASLFIPLTFVAGVYGMNFKYMPEIHYKYGYFIVLTVMGLIFTGMLTYFKKQKWF